MGSYNKNPKLAETEEFISRVKKKLQLSHVFVTILIGSLLVVAYEVSTMDRPFSLFTKTDQSSDAASTAPPLHPPQRPIGWNDEVTSLTFPSSGTSFRSTQLFSELDLVLGLNDPQIKLAYMNPMIGQIKPNYDTLIDGCKITAGWACDPDDFHQELSVHFYWGDKKGAYPSQFLGSTVAKYERKVVPGYPSIKSVCGGSSDKHGFIFPIPKKLKTGKEEYIWAFPIDYVKPTDRTFGGMPPIGGSPIKIKCKGVPTGFPTTGSITSANGEIATIKPAATGATTTGSTSTGATTNNNSSNTVATTTEPTSTGATTSGSNIANSNGSNNGLVTTSKSLSFISKVADILVTPVRFAGSLLGNLFQ